MDELQIIGSDGRAHSIPAAVADLFVDGLSGETITDAEWDEQMRRLEESD